MRFELMTQDSKSWVLTTTLIEHKAYNILT